MSGSVELEGKDGSWLNDERVIHFRVGARRDVRTVRVGRDLLLEVDSQSRVAGLWLLNVPPFPNS